MATTSPLLFSAPAAWPPCRSSPWLSTRKPLDFCSTAAGFCRLLPPGAVCVQVPPTSAASTKEGSCQGASPMPTKVCCFLPSPSLYLTLLRSLLAAAAWLLASTLHCLRASCAPLLGWLFTHLAPSDLSDFIPAFPLGTKLVVITFSTPCWAVALPS